MVNETWVLMCSSIKGFDMLRYCWRVLDLCKCGLYIQRFALYKISVNWCEINVKINVNLKYATLNKGLKAYSYTLWVACLLVDCAFYNNSLPSYLPTYHKYLSSARSQDKIRRSIEFVDCSRRCPWRGSPYRIMSENSYLLTSTYPNSLLCRHSTATKFWVGQLQGIPSTARLPQKPLPLRKSHTFDLFARHQHAFTRFYISLYSHGCFA